MLLVEGRRRVAAVATSRCEKLTLLIRGQRQSPAASHFEWARSRRPAPPGWPSICGGPPGHCGGGNCWAGSPAAACHLRGTTLVTPSTRPRHNFYTESRTRYAARRELLGSLGRLVREAWGGMPWGERFAAGPARRRDPELLRRLLRRLRGKARHFLVRLGLPTAIAPAAVPSARRAQSCPAVVARPLDDG